MKTVLAGIVAVALIAGAFFVRTDLLDGRGLLDRGDEDGDVVDGSEVALDPEVLRVVCDAALGDGCPADAERVALDDLLAAFEGQEAAYDVLVAPSLIIEYIEQSQTSRVQFSPEREIIARTPLLLASLGDAAEGLAACGVQPTWACATDLLATGDLLPGFPDPDQDSEGLVALAALTGGALETTAFSLQSLSSPDFLNLLDDLGAANPVGSDPPLTRLIQRNGAANNVAVVLEAPTARALDASQRIPPTLHWPTPVASLSVVAVGVEGVDDGDVAAVAETAAESLAAAGWRGPDGAPVGEGPDLPDDDDGLPTGGALFALQEEWN